MPLARGSSPVRTVRSEIRKFISDLSQGGPFPLPREARSNPLLELPIATLAYIAGFVDGEGCIGLTKIKGGGCQPLLTVANCDRSVLDWIHGVIGFGNVTAVNRKNTLWKQGFTWRVASTRCVEVIEAIYPYLHVKCAQAEAIFAWDAARQRPGNFIQDRRTEFLGVSKLLIERVSWLNHRGTSDRGHDPLKEVMREISDAA